MTSFEITHDDFLGGKVKLQQPKKGYRISSDSVFLAASLAPKKGEKILDVGAGSGAILSCLLARISTEATYHGIELQDELIDLARKNGSDNIEEKGLSHSI